MENIKKRDGKRKAESGRRKSWKPCLIVRGSSRKYAKAQNIIKIHLNTPITLFLKSYYFFRRYSLFLLFFFATLRLCGKHYAISTLFFLTN